jgi:hypothetical protein
MSAHGSKKISEAELAGRFHIASVSECGLAVCFCVQERKLISVALGGG